LSRTTVASATCIALATGAALLLSSGAASADTVKTGTAAPLLPSGAASADTVKTGTAPSDPDSTQSQERQAPEPAWQIALKFAMRKRGTPYVWGGTGHGGFDCSGLVLRAYKRAGIDLPRTAAEQYGAFSRKISWKHLKPGDLVFFDGLGHVGMVSRPGYMVDAPHTGDVVKEEPLSDWRRSSFAGAVRPDPKGVKYSLQLKKLNEAKPVIDSH
jgi:cell wall-associated NlpC family hydrolase